MEYVGKIGNLFTSLNNFYNEINPATLSGAIDIIVVEQPNGELASSPFHVRFGKLSVLLPQEKKVEINVNGEPVPYFMKVGEAGEAFFVFETNHEVPEEFQTSPILQAIVESRSNTDDPPFLDISDKNNTEAQKVPEDHFDDDVPKLNIPPELQSPKMIIEEQMDKVVTKMQEAHLDKTKNHVYSLQDGSTLLERIAPDDITTTTVAKERFIVRPLEGDLSSLWMDVTHTTMDILQDSINTDMDNESAEKGSIVLDMSGYKTKQDKHPPSSSSSTSSSESESEKHKETSKNTNSSWGWHSNDDDSTQSEDTVQLKSGQTYRIEMSLCGFSSFGYDEDENRLLFEDNQISYDSFVHNPSILNDPRLVFRYNNHYYSAVKTSPLFTSLLVFKKPLNEKESNTLHGVSDSRDTYSYGKGWRQWSSRSSSDTKQAILQHETTTFTTTTKTTSLGWSEHDQHGPFFANRKVYAKTLRLTSDQLKQLNLKKGVNTISFSVSSSYQGTATCVAKVFYWDYDIQVVISDIDGTITKSDTMGHLMTMIGKDWTHAGVAKLYTDIANNSYHFLYLTSRAIGQADYTRDYLKKVLQSNYQLPDGPVIMSPDRLFTSFHREVIMRKPEVFKMACLKDIQRLFGGRDPFYAGFGNRITDAISYRSVNVPSSKIFTIDTQSEVKLELVTGFRSSYTLLIDIVDQLFPPINKTIQEEYSDYNFWKVPMASIDIPELEEEGPLPTSPKPKPIKPDPHSLPKESVVTATPEPKRSLFRSFTSRSSRSNSVTKKLNTPIVTPTKTLTSFSSAPDLSMEINKKPTKEEDDDVDSIHLSSPRSLPDDYNHSTSDIDPLDDASSVRSQPVKSTSTGIISKLFSRRSKASSTNLKNIETHIIEENNEFNDDDMFNSALDLDMDKIPFI